jgi:hypothetical protein
MKQHNILMLLLFAGLLAACEGESGRIVNTGTNGTNPDSGSSDNITVVDSDTLDDDTGFPTDDSTTEEDSGGGPIEPTCTCNGVGSTLDAMVCAVDLCDPETVMGTSYASPSNATTTGTYAAVAHFGQQTNDLAPLYGASYALMASGPVLGTEHSKNMGGQSIDDPFAKGKLKVNDVMEWTLRLKAPKDARGFQIHYVFLSTEYDDWINTEYNDKFYVFLEAQSTNNGARTVINFTECRNPNKYSDFECDASQMACEDGERYCYIAINTALSECCWYGGCPNGKATTDISGTGFECAANEASDGDHKGSSTGWLVTEWPVEPEEEFTVIFHIHDTSDHIYDSQVIIDKFLFVSKAEAGTKPI